MSFDEVISSEESNKWTSCDGRTIEIINRYEV